MKRSTVLLLTIVCLAIANPTENKKYNFSVCRNKWINCIRKCDNNIICRTRCLVKHLGCMGRIIFRHDVPTSPNPIH
ncbi:hypothetical protein ScPMuIL_015258 [Solemya velum]